MITATLKFPDGQPYDVELPKLPSNGDVFETREGKFTVNRLVYKVVYSEGGIPVRTLRCAITVDLCHRAEAR